MRLLPKNRRAARGRRLEMVDVELGAARFEQFQRADENAQAENVTFVNNPALQETNEFRMCGKCNERFTISFTPHGNLFCDKCRKKVIQGEREFCFIFLCVWSSVILFVVLVMLWLGVFAGVGR